MFLCFYVFMFLCFYVFKFKLVFEFKKRKEKKNNPRRDSNPQSLDDLLYY